MTCNAVSKTPCIYTFFFDGYIIFITRVIVMSQNMCLHCYLSAMYSAVSLLNLLIFTTNLISFIKFRSYSLLILISAAFAVHVCAYQSNNVSNYLSTKVTHLELSDDRDYLSGLKRLFIQNNDQNKLRQSLSYIVRNVYVIIKLTSRL